MSRSCSLLLLAASLAVINVADATTTATKVKVQGCGASFPKNLYWDAIFAYQFVDNTAEISYASTGSGKGKCRMTKASGTGSWFGKSGVKATPAGHEAGCTDDNPAPKNLDYAGADSLLKSGDYTAYPDIQMYPTVAGAVVPIFNLKNDSIPLVLTPALTSRIFRNDVNKWDHADIKALNPTFDQWGIPANQAIEVTVRSDKSGTTEIYRKALSSFDATFNTDVGPKSDSDWKVFTPTKKDGNQGVASHVLVTPYTIGYATLGEAQKNKQPVAKMKKGTEIVTATAASVEYAVMELGLSFGNNGNPPSWLTADIHNAQGNAAWPIAGYTYVIFRKNSIRKGATCDNVKKTVDFWYWFWHSPEVMKLANFHGFATLPTVVRNVVVGHLKDDIKCKDTLVFTPPKVVTIGAIGVPAMAGLFKKFSSIYSVIDSVSKVTFKESAKARRALSTVASDLASNTMVLHTSASHTGAVAQTGTSGTLPFAGVGYLMCGRVPVILDAATLGKILDGDIDTWLHADIKALQPAASGCPSHGCIQDVSYGSTVNITNAAQKILLFKGPAVQSESFKAALKKLYPGYKGGNALAAVPAERTFTNEDAMRSALIGQAYSFGITGMEGVISSALKKSSLKGNAAGATNVVLPTPASVGACADATAFDKTTNTFDLSKGTDAACYPLSQAVYISYTKSKDCKLSGTEEPRTRTTAYIEWIFSGASIDAAVSNYHLAPLRTNTQVAASIKATIDRMTCVKKDKDDENQDLTTILGAVIGGAVGFLCLALACDQFFKYRAVQYQLEMQAEIKAKRKAAMGASGTAEDSDLPTGMLSLVETDVESSTALWDWDAGEMSTALIAHDECLRSGIKANGGMELLTEGDAFLVCFTEAKACIAWCLSVQEGLMAIPWTSALLNCGNESAKEVVVDGDTIFKGLRVRMGGHYGDMPAGNKVSTATTTRLYKDAHEIGDYAHGGQILVSNSLYAEVDRKEFNMDVCPVGNISDIEEETSKESALSCVQILPTSLKRRLGDFIAMFVGNEDALKPPCGVITCVFTSLPGYKKMAEADASSAEEDLEAIMELTREVATNNHGYECKGNAGKFLMVFSSPDDAVDFSLQLNEALHNKTWKADTTKMTGADNPLYKGYTMSVGMSTGTPTMFDYNKRSKLMDYFGPVVNRSARVCGEAVPGEICVGDVTYKSLSPATQAKFQGASRGEFELKGVKDRIEIFQIVPNSLSARMGTYDERRATLSADSSYSPSAMSPSLMSPSSDD
jgi:phosphate transport system substrate-binding protein